MMNTAVGLKIIGISLALILLVFVLGLFELYTQLGRYKSYWEKSNQKPAIPNEILYVALGDSTAQGIGATSPQRGYVGLIGTELETRQSKPVRVVNLSKSGAKIVDVLNTQLLQLEKLGVNSKTVITIEIGANNIVSYNESEFESQMDELMGKLPKQALISDIPYFGESRHKSRQPNVANANEIMYRLAEKHGFKLVALNEQMQKNGGVKTFAPDWFHPSNVAYRENWAPVFLNRIEL